MLSAKAGQYTAYISIVLLLGAAAPFAYHRLHQDRVLQHRGETLYSQGRFEEASQKFAEAVAQGRTGPRIFLLLADARLAAGNLPAAAEGYARLIEQDPKNYSALLKLAEIDGLKGRFDDAFSRLGQAEAIKPGTRRLKAVRARVLTYAGRYDEAIAEYSTILNQKAGETP